MSSTLVALVAFAAWTALLVFALANLRVVHTLRTKKPVNSYSPQGDDLEGVIPRFFDRDEKGLPRRFSRTTARSRTRSRWWSSTAAWRKA